MAASFSYPVRTYARTCVTFVSVCVSPPHPFLAECVAHIDSSVTRSKTQTVMWSRKFLMWGCCCPCTSCYYWYTECYSPSDCDCDCDCDCCCDSDFGVTDLLAGLCSIVFLPVIGVYYVCLMVYNGCAKCCGEGGCAEHVTAWDVLTYAVYIMFFPFIGIYIGCMHSGVPCMKWCISKEGDDVTFLCCSSPGWLQKYNFEDVRM